MVDLYPLIQTFINTHLAVNLIWRRDQPSKALKRIYRQMQYLNSIVSSFAWFPPDYAMRQKWLRLVRPILSGLQSEICLVCLDDIAYSLMINLEIIFPTENYKSEMLAVRTLFSKYF